MKRVFLTLLILSVLSSSVYANQTEDKIKDAISLYNSGNYAECVKNLNTIISQDSSYPVSYYYLGLSYAKLNKKDLAIKNYDKVISTSSDRTLKSMAKAAKDCLGTSGFTGIDTQLTITNSKAQDYINPKKENIEEKQPRKQEKAQTNKVVTQKEKMPSNDEIGAAIMTLKKAGLWNGSINNPQTVSQAQPQNFAQEQQNMMAKMYMQQMTQQMNNPAYLIMGMNGNNNGGNNMNMMNMLPFLMNNQNGDKAANQQLIQSMMMSQMMPNLDFSFSGNNDR